MNRYGHKEAHALLSRLFIEGAKPGEMGPLFVHLAECPRCKEQYGAYAAIEAQMCNRVPTPRGLARVEAAVLDRFTPTPQRSARSPWLASIFLVLGTACASFLLFFSPVSKSPDETLTARGESLGLEARVGIRVLRVADESALPLPGQKARLSDTLAFTYTNLVPETHYLLLFGLQDDGGVLWYYPDYGDAWSVAIQSGVDIPLDTGVHLEQNHHPGRLRITAVFSDDPLAVSDVEHLYVQMGNTLMLESSLASVLDGWGPVLEQDLWIDVTR